MQYSVQVICYNILHTHTGPIALPRPLTWPKNGSLMLSGTYC